MDAALEPSVAPGDVALAPTPPTDDASPMGPPARAAKAVAAAASVAAPKPAPTEVPVAGAAPAVAATPAVVPAPSATAAPAVAAAAAATPMPRKASLTMAMVRIEGGVLDEAPLASFDLDETEVTVAMYEACVRAGRCSAPALAEDGKLGRAHCTYGRVGLETSPVNCVTPLDADAFCAYAGKRLPSEEEWEWAAAGRDEDRRFVWGSGYGIPDGVCWKRKGEGPCEVGTSAADVSRDGVEDLAGNVQEWTTSTLEGRRVGRGGSWFADFGVALQIATFVSGDGSSRSDLVGFRCARSLD